MNLGQLYILLKPAVSPTDRNVLYQEYLLQPQLQDIIYSYWQLKTLRLLTKPFTYRVMSDGRILPLYKRSTCNINLNCHETECRNSHTKNCRK